MTAQEIAALRLMLGQHNAALMRDWTELESSLSGSHIPPLLEPYRTKLVSYCQHYRQETEASLILLQLKNDSILDDLISRTQVATETLRVISSRLATPVLRSSPHDTLCLKILTWIHQSHSETASIPVAFTSGDVAIWPLMRALPVYSFPALEQRGLLFQPLHYHEFGHGLYVLHKPEMDDLVKELQESVSRVLTPLSQRNDRHAGELAKKKQLIVNRWFDWAQEIFCDAVGLTIGGPAYLYAFSMYCNNLRKSDIYIAGEDMERSKHPVTWLRIHFLVRRAKEMGNTEDAVNVEKEWAALAGVMRITEDYHGYYEDAMEEDVYRIISDMLAEANPRPFLVQEITSDAATQSSDSSVALLNRAWRMHNAQPESYADWEKEAIKLYLV